MFHLTRLSNSNDRASVCLALLGFLVVLLVLACNTSTEAFSAVSKTTTSWCYTKRITTTKQPTTELYSSTSASTTTTDTTTTTTATNSNSYRAPQKEIDRRRNLAIISHPDSGKTTMTEKLLLYGGAVQQAGAVRQKAEQRATQSDFMEMEQERGISISSTVMNFDYSGNAFVILDTPVCV